jgi:hypothetical protein
MAEDGDHSAMAAATTDERPTTARKVPDVANGEDRTDVSPDENEQKNPFEDSIFANAAAHEQNDRVPSFDPTTLPSLPPPTDSSLLYGSENVGSEPDRNPELDEKAMQRHLSDVESSFMPVFSPIGLEGKSGVDDTYLFDASKRGQQYLPKEQPAPIKEEEQEHIPAGMQSPSSPETPSGLYKTPAPFHTDLHSVDDSTLETGNTTSELETMSSSPTAAAAARTVSRAISMAQAGYRISGEVLGLGKRETARRTKEISLLRNGERTIHTPNLQTIKTQLFTNFRITALNSMQAILLQRLCCIGNPPIVLDPNFFEVGIPASSHQFRPL